MLSLSIVHHFVFITSKPRTHPLAIDSLNDQFDFFKLFSVAWPSTGRELAAHKHSDIEQEGGTSYRGTVYTIT